MGGIAVPLLSWFDRHGRHELPWQHRGKQQADNAYRVWLSEIMLQQTQVSAVIPYFLRFIAALPTLPDLARADEDTVLALWSGLGYYRRARFLKRAAQQCMTQHNGKLPGDFDALIALPGIGASTAGAILAQAWDKRFPILDGNVKRVLTRYHGIHGHPGQSSVEKRLWQYADRYTPHWRVADYTQAIMDLGATVCVRTRPYCELCPLRRQCVARRDGLCAQLPSPKPRKTMPERHTFMLILRDSQKRVLLERRSEHGVWAGLWSLPEAKDDSSAWCQAQHHATITGAQALVSFTHVFSHYRLHVKPLLFDAVGIPSHIADHANLRWCDCAQQRRLGLPAPIRRLLQNL